MSKMNRKRGLFLVVVVLFLVSLSFSGLGAVEKFRELDAGLHDADGPRPDGCGDRTENHYPTMKGVVEGSYPYGKEGCTIKLWEDDDWPDVDDFCFSDLREGIMYFPWHKKPIDIFTDKDSDSGSKIFRATNWKTHDGNAYVCGEEYWWYQCSEEAIERKELVWAADHLLNCTKDDETDLPVWEMILGMDADHDTYTTPNDCRDNDAAINPGMTEVCGDNIDNDCDEGTSDECDDNALACKDYCLSADRHCSWIDTEAENKCCGDDGIRELGEKQSIEEIDLSYICLKKDKDLVGYEGTEEDFPGWGTHCGDEWCWIEATSEPFRIYTIKKPMEEPYDVVSNNNYWFECDEEGTKGISSAGSVGLPADIPKANRFYCYNEGGRWSWADCGGTDNGIKNRELGDGLFKLKIDEDDSTESSKIINPHDSRETEEYKSFYGDSRFDIAGYDYLEFAVKFLEEPKLPADIVLTIFGPEKEGSKIVYFEKKVLAYAVNNPLIKEERWIHVKVPVPEKILGVEGIWIESLQGNEIDVKHIYLSKEGIEPLLCSDIISEEKDKSAWFEGADSKEICSELYGERAWLGEEGGCCGNDKSEYYSGDSVEDEEGKRYACWNSQVIASEETTMNVEFDILWKEKEKEIKYDLVSFNYAVFSYYRLSESEIKGGDKSFGGVAFFGENYEKEVSKMEIPLSIPGEYLTSGQILPHELFRLELETGWSDIDLYFLNNFTGEPLGKVLDEEDLRYGLDNFVVVGETDVVEVSEEEIEADETFVYSCNNKKECTYPLPGFPSYEINNRYPELYDLVFVDEGGEEFLVENTWENFDSSGNLKTRKVSQQVIFDVEKDDEGYVEEQGFYGCQAADFIAGLKDLEGNDVLKNNEPYCSVKGDMFCAHKDGYLINSWSNKKLEKVGYDLAGLDPDDPEQELSLKDATDVEKGLPRNHSTSAVPGRNFVPNAEFETKGRELPHWEIFDSNGRKVSDEKSYVEDGKVVLGVGEVLKSEKIAVPQNHDIVLTVTSLCGEKFIFYDKNGEEVELDHDWDSLEPWVLKYHSKNTPVSYLTLEFTGGPCEVEPVMLQLVDDLGAAEYSYTEETERSGVACCPRDYCWNGYVCVMDMSPFTYMTEKVGEERNYRCIAGEWKHIPLQYDWNFVNWGFCSSKEQCFVSREGAGAEPEDFYKGLSPTCIDTGEFIFDYYCDKGGWTSRTRFLAAKLLEAYEDNEFVLYCTDPLGALVELEDDEEKLILGKEPVGISETGVGDIVIDVCFGNVKIGEDELIKPEENTCVNNICVLRFKEGGEFKTALATSLNKEIDDVNSFIKALGIPENRCQGEGEIVECDLSGLEMEGANLLYLPELKAIVYGKEGVELGAKNWWEIIGSGVYELATDFLGIGPSEEINFSEFIAKVFNFKELYLLNKDGKNVGAVQEIAKDKILTAEYANFETPICEYVENIELPPEAQNELLELAGGQAHLTCSEEGGIQKVEIFAGFDFFWPQLTGKLRVGE